MSTPGTNWKQVSPAARKKLAGILKWMRTTAHPEAECRRALMKRGMSEEKANKICSVAKDLAFRSTKWRGR
jgi:hypothetical protein